jgi:nucleoside-diphosphate-sugar epimerase
VQELNQALKKKSSSITLSYLQTYRDFVAATDVARAALGATQLLGRAPVINVGLGKAMSNRSMVELIAHAAGFEGEIVEEIDDAYVEEVPWQQADISRMGHEIGWTPQTTIAQAAEELWKGDAESTSTPGGIADQLSSW